MYVGVAVGLVPAVAGLVEATFADVQAGEPGVARHAHFLQGVPAAPRVGVGNREQRWTTLRLPFLLNEADGLVKVQQLGVGRIEAVGDAEAEGGGQRGQGRAQGRVGDDRDVLLEAGQVVAVGRPARRGEQEDAPPRPPAEPNHLQNAVDRPHVADVAHPVVGQDEDAGRAERVGRGEALLNVQLAAIDQAHHVHFSVPVDHVLGQGVVGLDHPDEVVGRPIGESGRGQGVVVMGRRLFDASLTGAQAP